MNFYDNVYQVVTSIPKGKVASYGMIAVIIGKPNMSRQVGWALHVNPKPGIIPCHRVVTKQGKVADSFAFGGGNRQKELLINEGVEFDINNCVKKEFFIDNLTF